MRFIAVLFLVLARGLGAAPAPVTFELGANFNEHLHAARLPALDAGRTTWIRGFLPATEFIDGGRDLATDPGLATFRVAAAHGRKVALTLKWDFLRSKTRVPAPDSARERACFEWAVDVVAHGRPDLLLLVNELYIDTLAQDLQPGVDGEIPMVLFLQRLAAHVAGARLKTPEGAELPVGCGGFTRINTFEMQQHPATRALLPWLASSPHLTHVNFHIHQRSLDEFGDALGFMRAQVPQRPFVITEFSLVWAFRENVGERLGVDVKGRAFCEMYKLSPDRTVLDYLNAIAREPVAEAQLHAFLGSRSWFDPRFLERSCDLMERHGVALATYAYLQESSGLEHPERPMQPSTPPWRLNPIFQERHARAPDTGGLARQLGFFDTFVRRQGKAPPNVLLILVDDLKPIAGSYDNPVAYTPNLDRLAARGVQFDMAYCNQAVCGPSRYNLMLGSRSTSTGLYSFGRQFRDTISDAVTLPQHFMRHGYRAESLGKIYHIGHNTYGDDASWNVPHHKELVIEYVDPASKPDGALTREEAFFSNVSNGRPNRALPRGAAWESPDVPDEAYADGRIATEAVRRLEAARARGTPFFLAVGFARPHLPFSAPKKYWDLYDRNGFELARHTTPPLGAPPYAGKQLGELNQYFPVPERPPLTAEMQRTLIHGYYASTSYMDAQFGRVLDAVDRLGLAENTIIVLWGDHGFSFGTHGDWTKHTNYEEANRIPLLFAGPGIRAGVRTRALAETVDLFPTLADFAGLPAPLGPQPIDGVSLAPALRDAGAQVKDHVYHCFPRGLPGSGERLGRAIRTDRYRLVEWTLTGARSGPVDLELYDYETDPDETINVAAQRPAVVAQLRALLGRHPAAAAAVSARP